MREYFQVGVPCYGIIDIPEDDELGRINLYGFIAGTNQYEPIIPDKKGRLWLEPVGLWLGVEGIHVYLEEMSTKKLRLAAEARVKEFEDELSQAQIEK